MCKILKKIEIRQKLYPNLFCKANLVLLNLKQKSNNRKTGELKNFLIEFIKSSPRMCV